MWIAAHGNLTIVPPGSHHGVAIVNAGVVSGWVGRRRRVRPGEWPLQPSVAAAKIGPIRYPVGLRRASRNSQKFRYI